MIDPSEPVDDDVAEEAVEAVEADRIADERTVVAASPVRHQRVLWAVVAVVVLADQVTKQWAVNTLTDEPPQHVFWTLQWNLAYNTGMAFSRGQGLGPIIGALALVVVAVLAYNVRKANSAMATVAAGLVVGGAIGNIIDRLFRGEGWLRGGVVDFIDFQWFPIFNIADSAVTIGGVLFVLWSFTSSRQATA